jgi:hypothetical protein
MRGKFVGLLWDRGRPARTAPQARKVVQIAFRARLFSRCALSAGEDARDPRKTCRSPRDIVLVGSVIAVTLSGILNPPDSSQGGN